MIAAEVIHAYSRAQALADGVLVDITTAAREASFRIPVSVTAGVWALIEAGAGAWNGQSTDGRRWDVLWMASCAMRRAGATDRIEFEVIFARRNRDEHERTVALIVHIGPGDEGEPAITIMLPGED